MTLLSNSALTNIEKLYIYMEPSSFLFCSKAGSFKLLVFPFMNFSYKRNILTSFLSLLGSLNKILRFEICIEDLKDVHIIKEIHYKNNIPFYNLYGYYVYASKYIFIFKNLLLQIFFSINRGWIRRLRLVGIGYKLYHATNLLVFKIGYNRSIIFLLPFDLRINVTGRKKRGFIVFGINKLFLTLMSKLLLQLRIPNIYTGKGIRVRGTLFIRKVGKKTLF